MNSRFSWESNKSLEALESIACNRTQIQEGEMKSWDVYIDKC